MPGVEGRRGKGRRGFFSPGLLIGETVIARSSFTDDRFSVLCYKESLYWYSDVQFYKIEEDSYNELVHSYDEQVPFRKTVSGRKGGILWKDDRNPKSDIP